MGQLLNFAWLRGGVRWPCAGAAGSCTISSLTIVALAITFFTQAGALPSPAAGSGADTDGDKEKATVQQPVLRWDEQRPGCTFSRGEDGKYRYGMWAGEVGVVVAVDAREVQIVRHRHEPILGVLITIHYRGAGQLETTASGITLQFIKHFKVMKSSLDPDAYIRKIQSDADAVDDEIRREVKKHPAEKQAREARLQAYQKSANELMEFLGTNSLREANLDRANPEVRGWVFFDTDSKWLGGWKAQEEFLLRVPVDEKIFEFPFKLPPEREEFILQKRE